ncbi:MAG: acetolactate synthase large subunit, partial [Bacteroidales bacterium]|nr:acetolactate synthase large subunit [Bacteroidales bacterium]
YLRSYNPRIPLHTREIESAAIMINHAEKPLILAGHGVLLSGAEKELKEFAEKTGIPVALTLLGLSAFPYGHRLYTGMLGMHGNFGPNLLTNQADLIIAIGMRFDDRVTGNIKKYAKNARIIHIEIDEAEINKNVQVDLEIHNDAREVLLSLIPLVKENSFEKWIREFRICDKTEYEIVIKGETEPGSGELRMGEVVNMVSDLTDGEAIIVTDVGQNQMSAARYYKFKTPNSLVTSGGMGTMGFGLPASIGAKLGRPDKQVVVFLGDGGFQMTMQELGTILQYQVPVKIIILNNSFLGMVRQWQDMFFQKRYASTALMNPDFLKIAEGYNIPSERVTEREDLKKSVEDMLKADGPYLLDITISKEANVLPMVEPGSSVSEIRLTY